MLVNDENLVVKLFVENLLWGKLTFNINPADVDEEGSRIVDNFHDIISDWQNLSQQKEDGRLTVEREINLHVVVENLYSIYRRGRIEGSIKGELHDVDS